MEPTLDTIYDELPAEIHAFVDFLNSNYYTIRGAYNDKFYKNGGWNGMMDAIQHVEQLENYTEPDLDIDIPGYEDLNLRDIIINGTIFAR